MSYKARCESGGLVPLILKLWG